MAQAETKPQTQPARRARWTPARTVAALAATAIGVPPAVGTLLGPLGRAGWLLDLFSHWRVQYFWLLAASTVLLLAARKWRLALLPAALAALNLALVAPAYWGGGDHSAHGRTYRLVAANIHSLNTQTAKVRDLLEREDPDVAVLTEFTPRWMYELRDLDAKYPVHLLLPHEDNFGTAVYSRLPLTGWQSLEAFDPDLRGVSANFSLDGRPLALLAVHAAPPLGSWASRLRNRQFRQLSHLAAGAQVPLLLAGDLNTSPWSPFFDDLLKASGLRDSRRGFGIQATWPAARWLMGIPLDHCLASASIRIVDRRVGPDIGSDHLPIIVDFALPGE